MKPQKTHKTCPACKTNKPASEFGQLKSGHFYAYCKPCTTEKSRIYWEKKKKLKPKRKTDSCDLLINGHKNLMILEHAMRGIRA